MMVNEGEVHGQLLLYIAWRTNLNLYCKWKGLSNSIVHNFTEGTEFIADKNMNANIYIN